MTSQRIPHASDNRTTPPHPGPTPLPQPAVSHPSPGRVNESGSSPRRRTSTANKASPVVTRNPTRVIRTFEEVEVQKLVTAEEWYEELECGICSHVLGGSQTLVPCGHTFCGTCAWQWIKTNKNLTCPHCRMELTAATPFVPNIIVDQIIDRKLRSLPDGKQKVELLEERQEKSDAWKVLQASLPSKPVRRSKALDDWMMGFFEHGPSAAEAVGQGHRRRASRHYTELGAPIAELRRTGNLLAHGGLSLGEIRRYEAEQAILTGAEGDVPRLGRAPPSPTTRTSARAHQTRPPFPSTSTNTPTRPAHDVTYSSPDLAGLSLPSSPQGEWPTTNSNQGSHSRLMPLRSQALAARQARGRTGTREQPLVVLSDSEED